MVITVTCPSCSSSFPVDPAKIPVGGVKARCTSCKDVFRIEKPAEAAPPPAVVEVAPPVFEAPPVEAAPEPEPELPTLRAPAPAAADDWVVDHEEVPSMEPEPIPAPPVADPFGEAAPFEKSAPAEASDPFAAAAPFEQAESLPAPPAVKPPAPAVARAPAAPVADSVQGFTFGKRDPTDKAKRLARVLVSDMIMYNAERHQNALAAGTLGPDFEEEIAKSWKEFVDQVGDEIAGGPGRAFWTDALNDILAKGKQVF
ncbi:MAG: zinc-ribbon domain-containing protein [Gemmatimonadetes bacterium]|nr:zinc-ribbon domain-containing protein [Gemmatimonadota bacterium]